ncbi:MAG: pyridoxal-dependent decarboxylase [Actinomycetes bacterium]
MSGSQRWQDAVVELNETGIERLEQAASAAIASLRRPIGPRSDLSPLQLHDLIWDTPICPEEGTPLNQVLDQFGETVWAHSVVAFDPNCVAHLQPPTLLASVVSEMTIAVMNQSMDSWDQAPAATEVELHLMNWLSALMGMAETASGVMTSGGTASNMLGMTLARSWASAQLGVDVLRTGLPEEAKSWRIVCSDQAHFSVQRAAAQLGLGRDAVVTVPSNDIGAMDITSLDDILNQLISLGSTVIAIVGTAGTTDLGAIDSLDDIATRCERVGAWFHVDAAVAGSYLMSQRLSPMLSGISRADSVTIDFHKLWFQPFNASALIVQDVKRFDLLRVKSKYLDRGDEVEGMTNLVGRSLDTSRRFDAAKIVATLRTLGRASLAEMLERVIDLSSYAANKIAASDELAMVAQPTGVMCVFDAPGYLATDLQRVQQNLLMRGEIVLGRTEIKGRAALKCTFMNPLATYPDVDRLIHALIDELNSKL